MSGDTAKGAKIFKTKVSSKGKGGEGGGAVCSGSPALPHTCACTCLCVAPVLCFVVLCMCVHTAASVLVCVGGHLLSSNSLLSLLFPQCAQCHTVEKGAAHMQVRRLRQCSVSLGTAFIRVGSEAGTTPSFTPIFTHIRHSVSVAWLHNVCGCVCAV